jgi:hypothetical protein
MMGDLKVIAHFLGLQLGYTKSCCFLCEWQTKTQCPLRQASIPERKGKQKLATSQPLVDPENVFLPPLYQT